MTVLAGGWSLIAVGVATLHRPGRRPAAALRILAGLTWFAGFWDVPSAPAPLFAASLVVGQATPVMLGHAAFRDRGRALLIPERVTVIAGYVSTVGLGLAGSLFLDPAVQGCTACPVNPWKVVAQPQLAEALGSAAVIAGMVWSAALAALIGLRLVRAGRSGWIWDGPALVPLIAYLGAVCVAYAHSAGEWFLRSNAVAQQLGLVEAVTLLLAALGACWPAVHRRSVRARIAAMVARLVDDDHDATVSSLIADVLGDPSVRMAYVLSSGELVDADGRPADADPGAFATPLARNGRMLALVIHRRPLAGDPDLVEAVAATASLPLDAERLRAERRAQLVELATSRNRIAEASRTERRRLQRDLHDGAQQQLVVAAVAVQVAMLRSTDPARVAALDKVRSLINVAVEDLREVSQGLRGGRRGVVAAVREPS